MEVTTELPRSGTKLSIDADREFDGGQTGDSVLRVKGQSPDGSQTIFDASYVEVDSNEAAVVGAVLRMLRKPDADTTDQISQEILGAFGAKLGGRDAHQIAEIAHRAWRTQNFGTDWPEEERSQRMEKLAERFERASAQRRTPAFAGAPGGSSN